MQNQNESSEPIERFDLERTLDSTSSTAGSRTLTAFRIPGYSSSLRIVPSPADRFWMDFTTQGWANRCLPLRVANQAGWQILNDRNLEVVWSGKHQPGALRINYGAGIASPFVRSDFGFGILTWYIPYLFRTPPGYNLLIRGPSNYGKDGIVPLEGLVETDWAVATFSVNWKVTRPLHKIKFDRDEPICMIVPYRRGELESFVPETRNLDGPLLEEYQQWLMSRQAKAVEKEEGKIKRYHQGHYTRGETVSGRIAAEHQTKLTLAHFVEQEPPPAMPQSGQIEPTPNNNGKMGLLRRLWKSK